MKFSPRKLLMAVALFAATIFAFSAAHAQNAPKAKGFLVYKNPVSDYVEVIDFSDLVDSRQQQPAPPYSTLRDMHGASVTVKNAGIIAIVYYPKPPYGEDFQATHDHEIVQLRALSAKFPQQRERFAAMQKRWDDALAESKKAQSSPLATPATK